MTRRQTKRSIAGFLSPRLSGEARRILMPNSDRVHHRLISLLLRALPQAKLQVGPANLHDAGVPSA